MWKFGRAKEVWRAQAGFTMVEMTVAAVLVTIGLLGTAAMINAANSNQQRSKDREAGTNLAREIFEDAHALSYAQIGASGWITQTLQTLQGGTGAVNTQTAGQATTSVTRRAVAYAVTVSWCALDDAKDGPGTHAGSVSWCSDSATGTSSDSAPQDFKRVTVALSYQANQQTKTIRETVTFAATGGMVAPAVSTLVPTSTPPGQTPPYVVATPATTDVTFRASSSGAADMKFAVNGVEVTAGVTNNGNGTWDYDWQIAALTDGTYTIAATAVDALGNRSAPMTLQVRLARGSTLAPQNVQGGYNYVNPPGSAGTGSLVVELQWDANPEGSVTGYEVLRGGTSVCGGQSSLATSCIDTSPPTSGSTVYTVKVWYLDSNNVAQYVARTITVTAPTSAVATQYWLYASTTTPRTQCDTALGGLDLLPTAPVSATDATSSAQVLAFCTPAVPAGSTLAAGTVTVDLWVTNTNNKACSTFWWISHNASPSTAGTGIGTNVSYTAPANSTTKVTSSETVPATALSTGDQINLFVDIATASGNCSKMSLKFGSTTHPTDLQLPTLSGGSTLATPGSISGLTVTPNADGTRTVSWTAPASSATVPAADFYRVYRDGTATSARIDTADAVATSLSAASAAAATSVSVPQTTGFAPGQAVLVDSGANQDVMTIASVGSGSISFTSGLPHAHASGVPVSVRTISWTDTATGGSSHTYRVSAVSANLAESAFAPAGGVTG